ncbi:mitochondrial distribution and morphology protein 31 [Trichomonascus vanleenenianus]|uniref:mitochondrial distribution and morphology protein n=1 Tax=Trichomonascus vanleenenianus TaxID=2268995 RepID=UPI003ECA4F18
MSTGPGERLRNELNEPKRASSEPNEFKKTPNEPNESGKFSKKPNESGKISNELNESRKILNESKKEANEKEDPVNENAKEEDSHWHRPTKEELLAAASGAFERIRIRMKWLLIRQVRPFNIDDISAMFSWILVGNLLWILLGTTTFCSLILLTMNTVSAQDAFARWVGNILTRETGLTVVFENAIVPNWRDGVISFNKVFVSRRPGKKDRAVLGVHKGSQKVAAAAAKATQAAHERAHFAPVPRIEEQSVEEEDDDGNYTQFDLTIETVSVTVSVSKWMDGRGFLKDVEVKGIRGVVDRSYVKWDEGDDPKKYKNVHQHGDFEIDNFKMEDALVALYQPGEEKPFNVSIFNCEMPQLRKHWLFYDILSATNMSGCYDNSLFTIHPRQLTRPFSQDSADSPWKKISRLRIDGVDIRHLNRGIDGPFGWIESGNVDLLADVMLPADAEEFKLSEVVQDIVERWEANLSSRNKTAGREVVTSVEEKAREREQHKYVVVDLRVQLNNTRAAVPLFTSDLTYINNALIRPIVAYINSRDTYIPINCRVVKRLKDFEGSWTIYDSGLMDDVSAEVYEAFAKNVADDEARAIRLRKVGFWSLQFAAQLLLLGLGAVA